MDADSLVEAEAMDVHKEPCKQTMRPAERTLSPWLVCMPRYPDR